MESEVSKFWSMLVIILSQPVLAAKKECFYRLKCLLVADNLKKIDRLDPASSKSSRMELPLYQSISDFKPLSNLYSSVKIYEEDCLANNYQTKKQKFQEIFEESKYCKLEDWMVARKARVIPVDMYPLSEFATRSISAYTEQALGAIRKYKFEDFCQTALKKRDRIMALFSSQKFSLRFKNTPISDSLVPLPDNKVELAIDIFEDLLMAGSEIDSEMPAVYYVHKFIKQIFHESEEVRQQAYFQVIKQMSSRKKVYYQILAAMSACVQPSSRMYLPLLNFVHGESLNPDLGGLAHHLNYSFYSLIKNSSQQRKAVPSVFEVYCYMNSRKIPITMCFPKENLFFVESYSSVEELLDELAGLYGLDSNTQFLLNLEGVLLERGSIMDGVNLDKHHHEDEEEQDWDWMAFEGFRGLRAFVVIKNMMEMHKNEQNFLIMFNYIVHQYRRGLFAMSLKEAIEIGGLIVASEIQSEQSYEFCLAKCIPVRKYVQELTEEKASKAQQLILNNYIKFTQSKAEARKAILHRFSTSKAFLTHFFYCNAWMNDDEVQEVWIGVKPESILAIEPGTSRLLLTTPYEKIKKWGRSSTQLCLVTSSIRQFHIESKNIDVIVSIFETYLKYLKSYVNKDSRNLLTP